jgi:site-specific recombinase XerD
MVTAAVASLVCSRRTTALDASHAFTEGEWLLVRTIANGLEWSYGWEAPAAQRLRFALDFAYGPGLRVSELVGACLGNIQTDARGDPWVSLIGKGHKAGKDALPPLARTALDRYLVERRLPVTPSRWHLDTPLVGSLEPDSAAGISDVRLWEIKRRFFAKAA